MYGSQEGLERPGKAKLRFNIFEGRWIIGDRVKKLEWDESGVIFSQTRIRMASREVQRHPGRPNDVLTFLKGGNPFTHSSQRMVCPACANWSQDKGASRPGGPSATAASSTLVMEVAMYANHAQTVQSTRLWNWKVDRLTTGDGERVKHAA